MIKLLVGLGNPGQKYTKNRHNAGFLLLDRLADKFSLRWSEDKKFNAEITRGELFGHQLTMLKPMTFMNRSGLSVVSAANYYKYKIDEILVVHDELDLPSGIVKLKKGGGHAGHNGLRDIISNLGSKDFYRVRLGIDRPKPGMSVADYVLSDFSKHEFDLLYSVFDDLESCLEEMLSGDIQQAMNHLSTLKQNRI